jgi:NAD(P)-dependent dehydrogenase (short-subunit alcohol dehydrogenase family)
MPDAKRKVALVTGANKGIGFAIAQKLARLGMTVLVAARDPSRGEPAAAQIREEGLDAEYLRLDVTEAASVEAAARMVNEKFSRLDILINNAAIASDTMLPPSEASLDNIRKVFETNFFGVIAVTQAMLPLLRKSAAGRIVNLTSGLGSLSRQSDPGWPFRAFNILGYNSSKTALNAFTVSLANELHSTSIKVNAASPGACRTDLNNNTGTRSPEEGAETPVWLATLPDDGPSGGFFLDRQAVPW